MRAKYRYRRAKLPPALIEASNASILRTFITSDIYKEATTIFTFVSIGDEIDTRAIINAALKDGKVVLVPLTLSPPKEGMGGEMAAVRIYGMDDLEESRFGLLEPKAALLDAATDMDAGSDHTPTHPDCPEPNLIIVPGLAVDKNGYRLGYGGGYYDRYLAGQNNKSTVITLQRKDFVVSALPTENHDVPVNYIVTEDGIQQPRVKPD